MQCEVITDEGKLCRAKSGHSEEIPMLGESIVVCGIHFKMLYDVIEYGTIDDLDVLLKKWRRKTA